jgi:hypothetical protein
MVCGSSLPECIDDGGRLVVQRLLLLLADGMVNAEPGGGDLGALLE